MAPNARTNPGVPRHPGPSPLVGLPRSAGASTAMTVSTRVAIPSPTVEAEQVVSVDGLRKAYGATVAVADVSFSVARGEIFGLLGPNGAGKTTTVECVQGLRRAGGGHIRVLGLDPIHQAPELPPLI